MMRLMILSLVFSLLFFVFPKTSYSQGTCTPACGAGQICQTDSFGNSSCVTASGGSRSTGGAAISSSCTTSGGGTGSDTALGCVPTEPAELVKWILGWSIASGGGIAFLLSLWGGVTIILAGGNPEKINEGREIITSAVSGLVFILLSIFLLRFIGVDVLGILI